MRPSAPKYAETWGVKLVILQLWNMESLCSLSLKDITLKLVILLALPQAARIQTLHLLLLGDINIRKDSISVRVVTFKVYTKDSSLCVCEMLKIYFTRTEKF